MQQLRHYQHPGYAFLHRYGSLQGEADVFHYADFLRRSAGLEESVPIDLLRIYDHFGIPNPLRVPLDEQQGILVDSYKGIILIKEDDPVVRQRFTEGHELIELLFDAQTDVAQHFATHPMTSSDASSQGTSDPNDRLAIAPIDPDRKEKLCDAGAAELLMPRSSFAPMVRRFGVSLKTARSLAHLYQTSLLATLVRMTELTTGEHAMIVWHIDHKPSERYRRSPSSDQREPPPEKKLRIWWRSNSPTWQGGFIPRYKSIHSDSLIAKAHRTGRFQQGEEAIDLGCSTIYCQVEAKPIQIGNKACVLSLLHL